MSSQEGEARNEEPGRRDKNCRAKKEELGTGRLKTLTRNEEPKMRNQKCGDKKEKPGM